MAAPHTDLTRGARKLILCFDGTGNKFRGDDSDSNILKIFRMLDRTAMNQYHYYQPGIGTYVNTDNLSHTGFRSRIASAYMKAKDSAIGSSFDQHVVGGYRFLMRFYSPGDEIYIFGFSRGAYIARFLAEMLDYVGLLSHGNEEMAFFAWKTFSSWQSRDKDSEKHKMYEFMKGFRETFSRPVRRIRFLGLFDTVNSVPRFEAAWMQRNRSPYTAWSSARVIRHAVSIDERRAKFRQDLIYQTSDHKKSEGHLHNIFRGGQAKNHGRIPQEQKPTSTEHPKKKTLALPEERGRHRPLDGHVQDGDYVPYRMHSRSRSRETMRITTAPMHGNILDRLSIDSQCVPTQNDDLYDSEGDDNQDVDEIWFAGGHGDVGGGWEVLPGGKSASHIPLSWMVREAMKAGLAFDMGKVVEMGCAEAISPRDGRGRARKVPLVSVPDIRVDGSNPSSPVLPSERDLEPKMSQLGCGGDGECKETHEQMLHKAHVARIHDSLSFDCGLGKLAVLSWRIMEYLPFRRMDLQADGSWKPIRWPLPCGEVRDIPHTARVHGSVIRRMQQCEEYRPGNLIVGGGGRGHKVAPKEHGMGEWECIAGEGDLVAEIWVRRT